jgi:ADP-ribosylglycohydrolase
MEKLIFEKIYGCLIGGAIGDALGAPVEGWNYWEIREKYGRLTVLILSSKPNSNQKLGDVTDDTVLRHYLALAIIRKGGRINPSDLGDFWVEKGYAALLWSNEHNIYEKLLWGDEPMGYRPRGQYVRHQCDGHCLDRHH